MTFRNKKLQFPHLKDKQINLLHNKLRPLQSGHGPSMWGTGMSEIQSLPYVK